MKHIQIFQKKVIERTAGVPYLIRWNLFGLGEDSNLFSIKVHKILQSDDECMHDHPWAFVSIILKGGYTEITKRNEEAYKRGFVNPEWDKKSILVVLSKKILPGAILYRPAYWVHKLKIDQPAWTLVFTFRKIKSWGFFTKAGFIDWKKYSRERDC